MIQSDGEPPSVLFIIEPLANFSSGYNVTLSGPTQTETTLLLITSTLPPDTSVVVSTSIQPASTTYIISSLPASTQYLTFTTISDRYITETSVLPASSYTVTSVLPASAQFITETSVSSFVA